MKSIQKLKLSEEQKDWVRTILYDMYEYVKSENIHYRGSEVVEIISKAEDIRKILREIFWDLKKIVFFPFDIGEEVLHRAFIRLMNIKLEITPSDYVSRQVVDYIIYKLDTAISNSGFNLNLIFNTCEVYFKLETVGYKIDAFKREFLREKVKLAFFHNSSHDYEEEVDEECNYTHHYEYNIGDSYLVNIFPNDGNCAISLSVKYDTLREYEASVNALQTNVN